MRRGASARHQAWQGEHFAGVSTDRCQADGDAFASEIVAGGTVWSRKEEESYKINDVSGNLLHVADGRQTAAC